jgi:hypothetical protein
MLIISVFQLKGTNYSIGLENQTLVFSAFKKCTSLAKTKYKSKKE